MKGYVSRTADELERQVLTNLINGLSERITFLGEELMELEEDEYDFSVKSKLVKKGYNCFEEDYNDKILDDINAKKSRITNELNEAKNTYEQIKAMI